MMQLVRNCWIFARYSVEAKSLTPSSSTATGKDKYRKYHKDGPELFLTHLLMVNGPLTSKELWRLYEKKLFDEKKMGNDSDFEYWPSLTQLKRTIKLMRINGKVKSNGYLGKSHRFTGWQIQ